jgi:hypothetical protein
MVDQHEIFQPIRNKKAGLSPCKMGYSEIYSLNVRIRKNVIKNASIRPVTGSWRKIESAQIES